MKIIVTGGAGFIPLFYKAFNECGIETVKLNIAAIRIRNIL
jgi:hypothetical protein